jgi:hypothetical protein
MDVLGLVYPQYWLKPSSEHTFPIHMVILKDFYSQPKKFGSSQTWIPVVLDVNILDLQSSFFKITMMSNAQWAMDQPMDVNPMSKIWKKFYSNALLSV